MNASLPTLPVPATSAVNVKGTGLEPSINQSDTSSSPAFGAVLEEAYAGKNGVVSANPAESTDANALARQLQALPGGGNLLPLLEQVLAGAEAAGEDVDKLANELLAGFELAGSDPELDATQVLAASVYQLLEANPGYAVGANSGPVAATGFNALEVLNAGRQPADGLAQAIQKQLGINTNADLPETAAARVTDPGIQVPGLDKLLNPGASQQALAPGQQQAELATMLAALKRLAGGNPALPDSAVRADALAGGAAQPAVQPGTSAATALPTLTVGVPFNQANWDQALGERIQWMVNQNVQGAQIKLNPAHLGPMEVRIQVQNDQANIQFSASHAVVRDALEAALPRLREMFEASGVELVDVDVSGESFAERQDAAGNEAGSARNGAGGEHSVAPETVLETPVEALLDSGRLDLYA